MVIFFEPKPAWFYGCRRFGDSTWVLNVEAEVVKTAMVLWVIPQIGDLFHGKSQSKMDDNGGSPILGNLQCWWIDWLLPKINLPSLLPSVYSLSLMDLCNICFMACAVLMISDVPKGLRGVPKMLSDSTQSTVFLFSGWDMVVSLKCTLPIPTWLWVKDLVSYRLVSYFQPFNILTNLGIPSGKLT